MESKEYFEKVMLDYNQNRNGRSLRKYFNNEGVCEKCGKRGTIGDDGLCEECSNQYAYGID